MPFSAKVILKSSSQYALKPLVTFELRYPKFVHGEFMTHRVISRNASSSRAIPTKRLIEEVRSDEQRAQPIFWGKNQKGMQAAEELDNTQHQRVGCFSDRQWAQYQWKCAANLAADQAEVLMEMGCHKQIVNRLLEPFSHINVVATATEWDNFFGLRLHWMAQPEMRHLAELMWKAYNEAPSQELETDQWHLPYVGITDPGRNNENIKRSVACCARVSTLSFDSGKVSTLEEDIATYQRLNIPGTEAYQPSEPIHASPAEHQATPDEYTHLTAIEHFDTQYKGVKWNNIHEQGNFVGWRQYRKMLPGESCAPLPDEYLPF